MIRGWWRQPQGAGLSPSLTKETQPSKMWDVAKVEGPLPEAGARALIIVVLPVSCEEEERGAGVLPTSLPGLG